MLHTEICVPFSKWLTLVSEFLGRFLVNGTDLYKWQTRFRDEALNQNSGLKFRKFHVPSGKVFRLHRPDLSHRVFGYCSCKQDTKERYWGQQFCQMEREISV